MNVYEILGLIIAYTSIIIGIFAFINKRSEKVYDLIDAIRRDVYSIKENIVSKETIIMIAREAANEAVKQHEERCKKKEDY